MIKVVNLAAPLVVTMAAPSADQTARTVVFVVMLALFGLILWLATRSRYTEPAAQRVIDEVAASEPVHQ